jgi:exopolysaccharide production protein ExoQ
MRKTLAPLRPRTPLSSRAANPQVGQTIGKRPSISKAGGASLVLLSILFCAIFYQNLPSNLGLNAPNLTPAVVGAPEIVSVADAGDQNKGNTLDRIIKVCMIVTSASVVVTRWSLARSLSKRINVGFAAFMVLIPLSAMWSIDSGATTLRFISLASIVLVCFAISLTGWHRLRFQQIVIPPIMFILVVSLLVGMVYPGRITEIGDDLSQKGAWHGITLTKNQFGMTASLGAIICFNRWLAREGRAHWAIIGTLISFVCLVLSRSNTSLLAAMIAMLFMVLVMRVPVIKQGFSTHVVIGLVALLLVYEMVIQDLLPGAYTLLAPIRSMTGKDGSLSGRTIIWDIIKQHIQAAPYLGSGYGAYWPAGPTPGSPSYVFLYLMFFYPSEAHNGYLDIVNDLGYLGLICLLVFLISYIRQGLELMRSDRSQAALYLALLFQQLVMNLSESEWFARDIIFTIIILGITCMSRALYESRLQARTAASAGK